VTTLTKSEDEASVDEVAYVSNNLDFALVNFLLESTWCAAFREVDGSNREMDQQTLREKKVLSGASLLVA
jgi:hypothetical protein